MKNFIYDNFNNFLLSCDWLQIHVKDRLNFLAIEQPYYQIAKKGQSKIFKSIYKITDSISKKEIATYCTDANECILKKDHGILKFDNQQLYIHESLKDFVIEFLNDLGFQFIGITRFDIAMDFQKFHNDLNPENFINKYVRNEIIKFGGSQFGIYGRQKKGVKHFETLSFGSKSSNINSKLYNKTKELENNKKPWISRRYENFFRPNLQVWRLEFTIFSMRAFFKNEGKLLNFNSLEVLELLNMYGIFIELFKTHYQFKILSKREKRVSRLKTFPLWHFDYEFLRLKFEKSNQVNKLSGRSEKIFIKKINELNNEFRDFDENFNFTAKQFINKIINIYDLHDWAERNNIDYEKSKNIYVEDVNEFIESFRKMIQEQNKNKRLDEKFKKSVTEAKVCKIYE